MDWPIRLASTDFDGTLYCEFDDEPFPVQLQELLAEFQRAGGNGRSTPAGIWPACLKNWLGRVSVQPDYIVAVEREIHIRA